MKTLIYAVGAIVLIWALLALGTRPAAAEDNDVPVKAVIRCGSLIGVGELLILFEGEVSRFEVRCGGPSV